MILLGWTLSEGGWVILPLELVFFRLFPWYFYHLLSFVIGLGWRSGDSEWCWGFPFPFSFHVHRFFLFLLLRLYLPRLCV